MANEPDAMLSSGGDEKKNKRLVFAAIGGLALVAAVVTGIVMLGSRQSQPEESVLPQQTDGEALRYAPQTTFFDLRLSAEENFLGQQVVYLDGKLTNSGEKPVRQLKVRLFFRNLMNQVILREDHEIFGGQQVVGPGQTKEFQIRFDKVPDSWNQVVPQIQIVSLRAGAP